MWATYLLSWGQFVEDQQLIRLSLSGLPSFTQEKHNHFSKNKFKFTRLLILPTTLACFRVFTRLWFWESFGTRNNKQGYFQNKYDCRKEQGQINLLYNIQGHARYSSYHLQSSSRGIVGDIRVVNNLCRAPVEKVSALRMSRGMATYRFSAFYPTEKTKCWASNKGMK